MSAPALPPGFVLDQASSAPPLPPGFTLDGAAPAGKSFAQKAAGVARDAAAGAVRGAGSIGATLLAPVDAAARAFGVENSIVGRTDRRQSMDGALGELGADTTSAAYATGKVGAEVAGTLGVGGLVANAAARMLPGASAAAAPILEAVRTAGMSAGGVTGAAGLAARTAGGAVTGAASAGLVDPGTAAEGAAIGAALPGVVSGAGRIGAAVGNAVRGPAQSPQVAAAVTAAREAGYVVPPTQARPTLVNRALEGLSGKITTAQNASARNQVVTNRLAAKALGLPPTTQITPEVLNVVRQEAGQAYAAAGQSGVIVPGKAYEGALDGIVARANKAAEGFPGAKPSPVIDLVDSLRSPSFDAESAISKIGELRDAADNAFRAGDKAFGRAAKLASQALEDAIEAHLKSSGADPALLTNFREARKTIAKTYTIQGALNAASGTVDARKLARDLQKGKPLSGELRQAGEFAGQFPKAAQVPETMGSLPQVSPLDFGGAGLASAFLGDPTAMLGMFARPAARAMALSGSVQNRLLQPGSSDGMRLALNEILRLGYQSAPVTLSTSRP